MDPQKLIRSVSELPIAEWNKKNWLKFIHLPEVNLSELNDTIISKKIEGIEFFNIRKEVKSYSSPNIVDKYDSWKNELLSFSEQNNQKFDLNEMKFTKIKDQEEEEKDDTLSDQSDKTNSVDLGKMTDDEEEKKIENDNGQEDYDLFPYAIPVMLFSKMEKILEKLMSETFNQYESDIQKLILITAKNRYEVFSDQPISYIGRNYTIPNNNEKDMTLSKKHCEIIYKTNSNNQEGFFLKDSGSANGTYIFVHGGNEIEIVPNLEIEIANSNFKVLKTENNEVQLLMDDNIKTIEINNNKKILKDLKDCEIYKNNGKILFRANLANSYQDGCWKKLCKGDEIQIENRMVFKLTPKLIFKAAFPGEGDLR